MNPVRLSDASGSIEAWKCGACRMIFANERDAETCCRCLTCGEPLPEDASERFNFYHRSCWYESRRKHVAEQLAAAKVVDIFNGPICFPDSDRFFASADEAIESCEEDELPEFAFCCTVRPVIDNALLEETLERAVEDWRMEDATVDDLATPESLDAAWAEFVEANKANVSWHPDHKRKVRLRTDRMVSVKSA